MLRVLVLLLLLANLGFGAWTQGWLDDLVGVRARGDREPERLLRQLQPATVVVVLPTAATLALASNAETPLTAAASEAPLPPPACLEAGPFDAVQVVTAEAALRSLEPPLPPTPNWSDRKSELPRAWLVYLGRFAGTGSLAKKEDDLKRQNVDYEEVHLPGLNPGLSLGRFDEKAAADDALAAFIRQGIRNGRVLRTAGTTTIHFLRFDRPDTALAARLVGLSGSQAAFLGKGFVTCAVATNR